MINCKNILKVVLLSLFICVFCNESIAQTTGAQNSKDSFSEETNAAAQRCTEACPPGSKCQCISPTSCKCVVDETQSVGTSINPEDNVRQDPTFCSGDLGLFTDLVTTGQDIFNRLRDLIYVVAGFGIIAVAVGGFFGNLNWKWLGAIVISLIVIATAGELIVLLTGCEQFGSSLITNTLTEPTERLSNYVNFDDSFAYSAEEYSDADISSEGIVD